MNKVKLVLSWGWFFIVQILCLAAMVLGWFILIPFCIAQAWRTAQSRFDPQRQIDVWNWKPLDLIFGNPEDGASGTCALVWNSEGSARVPYMPTAHPSWRAYCWAAWRNSANGLKYLFAWKDGPFKEWTYTLFGKQRTAKAGWQEENGVCVPVFSP